MSVPRSTPPAYRFAAGVLRPTLSITSKVTWTGTHNIPQSGGFIAAANHTSAFDPLTFLHFMYANGRPASILAKESLFKVPGLGWLLRHTGMVPVQRGTSNAIGALAPAITAVCNGGCVAVFPEGTLTKDPEGWPMKAKTGVVRIALASGAPVIPVAQWGAQAILPHGAHIPKLFMRKPVSVTAGEPVNLDDLRKEQMTSEVLAEGARRVMAAITDLLIEIRGEEPSPEAKARIEEWRS